MKGQVLQRIKALYLQKDSLLICILAGVLLLVISWPIEEEKETKVDLSDSLKGNIVYEEEKNEVREQKDMAAQSIEETKEEEKVIASLEKKLESLLLMMEGVGEVKVMITLDSLGEKVLEKDIPVEREIITETDSQGGSRNTNHTNSQEATVYITDTQGNKIPYVITETLPKIQGVTVVCQGGDFEWIQKNITEVIQALFGIDAHKIKVAKMKQIK